MMDRVRRWGLSFTTSIAVGATPENMQLHAGRIVGILRKLSGPSMLVYKNGDLDISSSFAGIRM